MSQLELYSAALCPFAHRVRLAISEKRLRVREVEVDLRNKPAGFLDLSPHGKVPLLVHAGRRLWESAVISEYLEEVFPERPLMPQDPHQRALTRIWINFADTHLYATTASLMHSSAVQVHAQAKQQLLGDLRFLESEALNKRPTDGPYLLGSALSLADLALYPWFEQLPVLEHYRQFTLPTTSPKLTAWYHAMAGRDAVRAVAKPTDFYLRAYGALTQA